MNRKEWKISDICNKYEWYNKTRKLQRSLQYNPDASATVIHHLRDTEEQMNYNDEHYELWGHNLDGSFEYGKYVIFVTKEEHAEIHSRSEETRAKVSIANKLRWEDPVYKNVMVRKIKESWTQERKESYSKAQSGENNPWYGKHDDPELSLKLSLASKKNWLREDYRHKLHVALTSRTLSDDLKKRISESTSGEKNHFYGKTHSYTDIYRRYRNQLLANGIHWNLFQKLMSHGQRLLNAIMFTYIRCVLVHTKQ